MLQHDAFGVQRIDQLEQLVQAGEERLDGGDLRADVAVDADHFDVGQPQRHAIGGECRIVRDAELVLAQPGRDVRMRAGVDVRIHAQRHRGALAERAGDAVQPQQFALGLDVEAAHARLQGHAHLGLALADAREHDPSRVAAGRQHPRQLAPRDDVEPGALARQQVDHRQVRVRLQRIADQHVARACGTLELGERIDDRAPSSRRRSACRNARRSLRVRDPRPATTVRGTGRRSSDCRRPLDQESGATGARGVAGRVAPLGVGGTSFLPGRESGR